MFTGLIENTGKVLVNRQGENSSRLVVSSSYQDLKPGESIAVNGVCLTLLPADFPDLCFDISPETLHVTTLSKLSSGDMVNLERAMLASTRFGGHYVSGHVDTRAKVKSIRAVNEFIAMDLDGFIPEHNHYLIPKGSITVDGVSLTINTVSEQTVGLMLVPHTLLMTNLGSLRVGQQVNIEFDYLTRIVAHQLQIIGKLNQEEVS
ncbi:TPA: riboflavin synthase [Legionella pneumophila]|uniref:riboflavin synthase n=1 Tax=Legionella pneumophila TaxID=446 RepID=UPI00031E1EA9|nr:riboflavin synthase [Legionella pneumophila]MCK1849488.1 riboflavin synthase [Legionella pneumophila]MDI9851084.1 riboflavin synthase [Legionella pneumophila]MDW8854595.1 riboflavin synthase [Legionella pneumophila]MDW8865953.1 riboflavin synthase [Legionella pneumophila]MDW8921841.1 riboflavin synthase [Legionella pneumophila]